MCKTSMTIRPSRAKPRVLVCVLLCRIDVLSVFLLPISVTSVPGLSNQILTNPDLND